MTVAAAQTFCETFTYRRGRGWSIPRLPKMDSVHTLVVAFGATEYFDEGPWPELRDMYPQAVLLGCSTAGEIHGTELQDDGIVVGVVRFEHTRLRLAGAPVATPADSFRAGETIARQLAEPDLRGLFVLSDGLHVNGSQLVAGMNSVLPTAVTVTGGLAGDRDRFKRTWVMENGRVHERRIVAAGFYGDRVRIGHGSRGGWDVFGPERLVTRSDGNVLFEVDGKPVLPLYKEYLGDLAGGLPATALLFPLSMRGRREDTETVVRTILSVDEKARSMTFAGDIPKGAVVQFMRANFDRLISGASEAAQMTRFNGENAAPCFAVAISCVGRRLVLKQRVEEELESTLEVFPRGTKQIGFYSYGEISPHGSGRCSLHNQTMTLTSFLED